MFKENKPHRNIEKKNLIDQFLVHKAMIKQNCKLTLFNLCFYVVKTKQIELQTTS